MLLREAKHRGAMLCFFLTAGAGGRLMGSGEAKIGVPAHVSPGEKEQGLGQGVILKLLCTQRLLGTVKS